MLNSTTTTATLWIMSIIFVSVRELHREFLRSGADVMQALTFYASDDKLENRGNSARIMHTVWAFYAYNGVFIF